MFSVEPAAVVQAPEGDTTASNEVDFWVARHVAGLKAINLEVVGVGDERPDRWQIAFQAELLSAGKEKARSSYVIEGQMWAKQGTDWKIVGVRRAALTKLQQPTSKGADLYGHSADAHAEINRRLHAQEWDTSGYWWCLAPIGATTAMSWTRLSIARTLRLHSTPTLKSFISILAKET